MAKAVAAVAQPETKNPTTNQKTCVICGEEVKYPDFKCKGDDANHQLEPKTYYDVYGAAHVQSIRDRRMYAPLVILVPRMTTRGDNGQPMMTDGLSIQFEPSGLYTTSDAREQFYLDKKRNLLSGDEGQKAWNRVYLTQEQQNQLLRDEAADLERKIADGNSLLDQQKRARGVDA